MRASSYAQALHELAIADTEDDGRLVKQFIATVAGNGHTHLLPKIVRSLLRIEKREEERATIEVTSATPLSPEEAAQLLKQEPFKHLLSASHKKLVRRVDETLVGGEVVRTGSQKIDASHKRALIELYQHLISK